MKVNYTYLNISNIMFTTLMYNAPGRNPGMNCPMISHIGLAG